MENKCMKILTVGDLKDFLDNFTDDTPVYVCGSTAYIHSDEEGDCVSLDYEEMVDIDI